MVSVIPTIFGFIIAIIGNYYILYKITSWYLLIGFVFVIIEIIQFNKLFTKRLKKLEKKEFDSRIKLHDNLIGLQDMYIDIISYNKKDYAKKKILKSLQENNKDLIKKNVFSSFIGKMQWLPFWLCEALVYIVGAILTIKGQITIGIFIASFNYMFTFLNNSQNLINYFHHLRVSLNSYSREEKYFKIKKDLPFDSEIDSNYHIYFQDVYFSYEDNHLFEGISLKLPSKGLILVEGENGSGKTTFLNLLMGIERPQKGDIYIGNKNTKSFITEDIHLLFSCCFQDGQLLDDTILNNIKFGNKGSDEKLNNTLMHLDLNDKKIETFSSEVSGGEKKKILLLRAINIAFEILILDEPDSALDANSWQFFSKAINNISKTNLVFLVSHEEDENNIKCDYILQFNKSGQEKLTLTKVSN